MRWRHPGMEMGADLGLAGVAQGAEEADRVRIGRDRIVDDIGRNHAEPLVNLVAWRMPIDPRIRGNVLIALPRIPMMKQEPPQGIDAEFQ